MPAGLLLSESRPILSTPNPAPYWVALQACLGKEPIERAVGVAPSERFSERGCAYA